MNRLFTPIYSSSKGHALMVALLGMSIFCPPAQAEIQGRLFFTPERRASLERQRQYNIREEQALEGDSLSLNGVVKRSSGKSTVWINQRPQHEHAAGAPVTAQAKSGGARLAVGTETAVDLQVGESINRGTREKNDVLKPGSIHVEKSRSKGQ